MKKFLTLIIALLLALTACTSPAPTSNPDATPELTPTPHPTLSPELEERIMDGYVVYMNEKNDWEYYRESIWGLHYYGQYNGCEVVFLYTHGIENATSTSVPVAGYIFDIYGSNYQALAVYKDTRVLDIVDAYEAGWLTDKNVGEIWQIYNLIHPFSSVEKYIN
jgi:hypothetical protein